MIQRIQHTFNTDNSNQREHYIPKDVYAHAVRMQQEDPRPPGQGRRNIPNLADIYYHYTLKGLELVEQGAIQITFTEIQQPVGNRKTGIKFPTDGDRESVNGRLEKLKERADNGEFTVEPFKTISLISLAVNLMRQGIAYEELNIRAKRAKSTT